jgi:hypothetical protein
MTALPAFVEALLAIAGILVVGAVAATAKAVTDRLRSEAQPPTRRVVIEINGERTEMTGTTDEVERSIHEKLSEASPSTAG